jgi:hypothetical protein
LQVRTKIKLLCPGTKIFRYMQEVEIAVTTPILTQPRFFCVLKEGIIFYLSYRIRSHPAYLHVEEFLESILSNARCSTAFVKKWAPVLTAKLFDLYQRSAANDFVIRTIEDMKGLNNCSERLQFRNQVLTDNVKMLND